MDKAKQYSNEKYSLAIAGMGFDLFLLFVFLASGLSKALAEWLSLISPNAFFTLPAYITIAGFAYYLLDFPLHFYGSYILEHKYSLSTQRLGAWFLDELKASLIALSIAFILVGALYFVLNHFLNTWWLIISLFWVFFNILLAKLVPIVIIPLFFKYKKISDESLRQRILSLADKMKVKILDVFEIDFSKKTVKANAAFVGVGSTRRVLLADTLQNKYTPDEIEVVLAHEFAHYRLRHLLKLVLINSAVTVVTFYIIYKTSSGVVAFFGFSSLSEIAALPVVLLYMALFGIIMQPLAAFLSRVFERNADRLSLAVTQNTNAFISMMDKLGEQNLADRSPHPLIKFFFFDHPPIDERIKMAKHPTL